MDIYDFTLTFEIAQKHFVDERIGVCRRNAELPHRGRGEEFAMFSEDLVEIRVRSIGLSHVPKYSAGIALDAA